MGQDTLGYLTKEYPKLAEFLYAHRKTQSLALRARSSLVEALEAKRACSSPEVDLSLAEHYLERGMAGEALDLLGRYIGPDPVPPAYSEIQMANAVDLVLPVLARTASMVGPEAVKEFVSASASAYSKGIAGSQGILSAALALKESGVAAEALELSTLVLKGTEVRSEALCALRISLSVCLDLGRSDYARELLDETPYRDDPEINPSGFLTSSRDLSDASFEARLLYVLGRREEAVSRATAYVSEDESGFRLVEDLACLSSDLGDNEVADWCISQVISRGIPSHNPRLMCIVAERLARAGDISQAVETYGMVIKSGECVDKAKSGLAELMRVVERAEELRSGACPQPPDHLFMARKHMKRREYARAREEYLLHLLVEADGESEWRKEAEEGIAVCNRELGLDDEHQMSQGRCLQSEAGKPSGGAVSVLIASPVRQKPAVLREFLRGLADLELHDGETEVSPDFLFVDDNAEDESSELLYKFRPLAGRVYIAPYRSSAGPDLEYKRDDITHRWNDDLIDKVGALKDFVIEFALASGYDYVFFVDSDLVLHPKTLTHLVWTDRDIVSEVFWTKWQPEAPLLPQVWLTDQYGLYEVKPGEKLDKQEAERRASRFVSQLKIPGLYRVGGLGACTLIKRRCLEAGVRFARIDNLTFWGEDRFFCVRARALGLDLYADTKYPPLHLYRDSDLGQVREHKQAEHRGNHGARVSRRSRRARLTLSMLVRNEAQRYLREVLESAAAYVDEAVILDDASDDDTADVCREVMDKAGIPLILVSNKTPGFNNEIALRKQQWDLAVTSGAEWILCLDADEVLEEAACFRIRALIEQDHSDVISFRLYDMWDRSHYRDDKYWTAHHRYFPFLVRYRPHFDYRWKETPLHCGRLPANLHLLPNYCSDLRVKHLGWSSPADRERKYQRYLASDPEGKYGIMAQYKSILDPRPNLVKWKE